MPQGRKQLKERRDRLFRKNPNCPLCSKQMYLPKTLIDQYGARHIPREMQYRMATIDHVRTKFDPKRRKREDITRTRLMCLKCNNDLGNTQYNALPIEELRSRAGKPEDNWKTSKRKARARRPRGELCCLVIQCKKCNTAFCITHFTKVAEQELQLKPMECPRCKALWRKTEANLDFEKYRGNTS